VSGSLALSPEAERRRLVGIEAAASYVGKSIPEIRRLLKLGRFPQPRKPNGRRLAWQIGQLIDYSDAIFRNENS
jgi:predicted DNA-binding transcriptional regulator AlpA